MNEGKKENETKVSTVNTESSSSDTITIKKDTLWKYSTFILAAILVVGAFAYFNSGNDNNVVPSGKVVDNPGQQVAPPAPSRAEVNIEGAPFKGEDKAPVILVEYSDYQCPFCGRHYSQTYPQILKEYVDTGKVKYVMKDFPLSFHQYAQKSSEAAYCVRDQKNDDGYWAMHDKIFANQDSLSIENLKKWARE